MFEVDVKAIRAAMLAKQMTIRDLAKAAGVTETTAGKIFKGCSTKLNGRIAGAVANALGLSPEQILKGDVE